jgi:hypothetical protein
MEIAVVKDGNYSCKKMEITVVKDGSSISSKNAFLQRNSAIC